jgi:tetratricopeptide (TPR) repeat protein
MEENKSSGTRKDNAMEVRTSGRKKLVALVALVIVLGMTAWIFNQYLNGGLGSGSDEPTSERKPEEYVAYAAELIEPIKVEMAKPVSPYKFMLNSISEVEDLLWKGLDMDTTMPQAWEMLGYINAQFHGKQALMRFNSYREQGKEKQMKEAEREAVLYFAQADVYYDKALEFNHPQPDEIYFLKGEAAYTSQVYQRAAVNYNEAVQLDRSVRKYKARLIDAYLYGGMFESALRTIDEYRRAYPDSELPYRNLGGYYLFMGDTTKAMGYYVEAAERGSKPEVGKLLYKYYMEKGDEKMARYFLQKAQEAEVSYDPEKY